MRIREFVAGYNFDKFAASALVQSAVERQFEIIGEATGQLAKADPAIAEQIPDYRRLIAFRNILIHGYADVDDELVWDLLQTRLPGLLETVQRLIAT